MRPGCREMFVQLCDQLPDFEERLAIKPGLTAMAQIYCGYDTDIDSVHRKLSFDLKYIQNIGLAL